MATAVSYRRGNESENNEFIGVEGEIAVNLSNGTLRVHTGDGLKGGYELARKDLTNIGSDVFVNKLAYNNANPLLLANLSNLSGVRSEHATGVFTDTYNLALKDGSNLNTVNLTTRQNDTLGPRLATANASNMNTSSFAGVYTGTETIPTLPGLTVQGYPLAYADLSNVSVTVIETILENKFKEYLKADYSNIDTKVLAGKEEGLPAGMPTLALSDLSNVDNTAFDKYQLVSNIVVSSIEDDSNDKYPSTAWVNEKIQSSASNILPLLPDVSDIPETEPEDDSFEDPRPYLLVYGRDYSDEKFNATTLQWLNKLDADKIKYYTDDDDTDYIWLFGEGNVPSDLNAENIVEGLIAKGQAIETNVNKKADKTTVTAIESKIPSTASTTNKLADENFVNSSINNMAAFYITSDEQGDAFPTKAALLSGPYYFNGKTRTLAFNDYALVISDESKNNATTRYLYTIDNDTKTGSWAFQYVVNNSPFTAAQLAAINSGITATAVTNTATHLTDTDNPHEVTAAQVGLGNVDNTSDLNKPISTATQTALNAKLSKTDAANTYATITIRQW